MQVAHLRQQVAVLRSENNALKAALSAAGGAGGLAPEEQVRNCNIYDARSKTDLKESEVPRRKCFKMTG